MNVRRILVTAALSLAAVQAGAQTVQQKVTAEKGAINASQLVEVEATIQSIDLATREVVLKNKEGKEMAVTAGPDVKRLADLKVGDEVTIQYAESLTLALSKVEGGAATMSETTKEMRAEPTELPGGIKAKQTNITAKVTAIDAAASKVTVVGPKGRSVELAVDPEVAKRLKVGDLVSAIYTEAVAVSVSRANAN
jgi:hypothetical protein